MPKIPRDRPVYDSDEWESQRHRSRSKSPKERVKHRKQKRCHEDRTSPSRRHAETTSPPRRKIKSDPDEEESYRENRDSYRHDRGAAGSDAGPHRSNRGHRQNYRPGPDRHSRRPKQEQDEVRFDPHRRIKQEPGDEQGPQRRERQQNDERRQEARHRRRQDRGGRDPEFDDDTDDVPQAPKEAPNFEVSGKLTEDTNTYRGVVIKYNEPADARKPRKRWRLYPFKGDEALPVLHLHRQSAYLLGRDRIVADIPIDHPSCSKQHAALQFRLVPFEREDGTAGRRCRPYVIDLGSSNGTFINNQKIEPQHYVELLEKDVIKFGFSSREYVLLTDKSDTSELHDEGADST